MVHGLRRIVLLAAVLMFAAGQAFGFSFGLTPNADGQLDPWAYGEWKWSKGFSGVLNLRSKSKTSYEDADIAGLAEAITTVERSFRLQLQPFVYKFLGSDLDSNIPFMLRAGFGVEAEWLDLRETGYLDTDDDNDMATEALRVFFSNARKIFAAKPALMAQLSVGKPDDFGLELTGNYMPYVYISLDHELATAANGTDYDTPRTSQTFGANTYNAWSVGLRGAAELGSFDITALAGVEGGEYMYSMLALGGGIDYSHIYVVDSFVSVLLGMPNIQFSGLTPQVGFGFERGDTRDLAVPDSETVTTFKPTLHIGFKAQ